MEMSDEVDSCIGILPVEMKFKIFSFLTFEQKKIVRLVCSHWRAIIEDTIKLTRFVFTNQTWNYVQNYDCEFVSFTIQNLTNDIPLVFWKEIIPNSLEYILGPKNSLNNIRNFLNNICPHAQTLVIQDMSLFNFTGMNRLNWSNIKWSSLSTLSITMGKDSECNKIGQKYTSAHEIENHIKACRDILIFIHIKTLKTLMINTYVGNTHSSAIPFTKILEFILKHSLSLRKLKFVTLGHWNYSSGTEIIYLRLSRLILETLCITFNEENSYFAQDICERLKVSEELDIRQIYWNKLKNYEFNNSNFQGEHMLRFYPNTMKYIHWYSPTFDLMSFPHLNPTLTTLEIKTGRFQIPIMVNFNSLPYFPFLTKFNFWIKSMEGNLCLLIEFIINQMPNIENMELILFDQNFNAIHVLNLIRLQNLQQITLSLGTNQSMDTFTQALLPFIYEDNIKYIEIGKINCINININ